MESSRIYFWAVVIIVSTTLGAIFAGAAKPGDIIIMRHQFADFLVRGYCKVQGQAVVIVEDYGKDYVDALPIAFCESK